MCDLCGKVFRKDPAVRGNLVIINQVTAITCIDADEFTSDEMFANMILSNMNINVSDISNPDTRYGKIKSKNTKQVDY